MFRMLGTLTALVLLLSGGVVVSGDTLMRSALHGYRVVTVVDGSFSRGPSLSFGAATC